MHDTIKIIAGAVSTGASAVLSFELVVQVAQLLAALTAIVCGGITIYLFVKKMCKK